MTALTRQARRLSGAALACALLFTSACGGDSTNTDSTNPTGSDPMAAFRTCMEKQGVTMPQGRGGPSGGPSGRPTARPSGATGDRPNNRPSMSAEQRKAMQACASLSPRRDDQRGPGPRGQGDNTPANAPE
ncbi:hypothetical protein ACIBF1_00690 [Spirillospora sp. NPDC050679]